MKDINELYNAYVRFPKDNREIVFAYSAMEIEMRYDNMIQTKHPYFISRNDSTRYFEKHMLNKQREITEELFVFYSESKDKCLEWLENKRNTLLQAYKSGYERLKESEIREVKEKI